VEHGAAKHFQLKHEQAGNLEAKVKSFCEVMQVLRFLKDFILFAEKEEELQKLVLRQHQMAGRTGWWDARSTRNAPRPVWHTQGSGKTYTMIKASEMLFKAPEAQKPTILLMIDRNELEDQMLKNLASVGLGNVAHAGSIAALNRLLREDYRGIIVTMIHKFRDMPANLNQRKNIYVLIDEAHRTTGGDLGIFLMAGLPNATFIGFTGTPVDKTVYGKGTFKTFAARTTRAICTSIPSPRASRTARRSRSTTSSRRTKCWCARDHGKGVPCAGGDGRHRGH